MKIDLVYLWCDDRDANFRRKRLERMREFNFLQKRLAPAARMLYNSVGTKPFSARGRKLRSAFDNLRGPTPHLREGIVYEQQRIGPCGPADPESAG